MRKSNIGENGIAKSKNNNPPIKREMKTKKRKNHFVLSNASEPVMPQEPNKSKLAKGEKKREKREK